MIHFILTPLPDAAKSNPRAASVRLQARSMSRALSQRRHDLRKGKQPNYVDDTRSVLNRELVPLRPLAQIQRENETLRAKRGCERKTKSNAAVVVAGIITFGREAQLMFALLSSEQQDAAYLEVAQLVAKRLSTSLEALVVHADESAGHAHFTLRGYSEDGQPVSKIATRDVTGQLQDIIARVMQKFCPDIERGNKKWDRIGQGANYADTVHRSVKKLHHDLPYEIAALHTELARLTSEASDMTKSIEKTRRHLAQAEIAHLKATEQITKIKRYRKRLAKKRQS